MLPRHAHYRHELGLEQVLDERRRTDEARLADQAEIGLTAVAADVRTRLDHRHAHGVRARQPDGRHARRHEGGNEPGVYGAGQDGNDDVERVGVGDAQPVDRLLARPRRADSASISCPPP